MNWKPAGPWVKHPDILKMMFDSRAVRPGDFLWLHTSYFMESKIVIVIDRVNSWASVGSVATLGVNNCYRHHAFAEVKAWCRPPLDLEL